MEGDVRQHRPDVLAVEVEVEEAVAVGEDVHDLHLPPGH